MIVVTMTSGRSHHVNIDATKFIADLSMSLIDNGSVLLAIGDGEFLVAKNVERLKILPPVGVGH